MPHPVSEGRGRGQEASRGAATPPPQGRGWPTPPSRAQLCAPPPPPRPVGRRRQPGTPGSLQLPMWGPARELSAVRGGTPGLGPGPKTGALSRSTAHSWPPPSPPRCQCSLPPWAPPPSRPSAEASGRRRGGGGGVVARCRRDAGGVLAAVSPRTGREGENPAASVGSAEPGARTGQDWPGREGGQSRVVQRGQQAARRPGSLGPFPQNTRNRCGNVSPARDSVLEAGPALEGTGGWGGGLGAKVPTPAEAAPKGRPCVQPAPPKVPRGGHSEAGPSPAGQRHRAALWGGPLPARRSPPQRAPNHQPISEPVLVGTWSSVTEAARRSVGLPWAVRGGQHPRAWGMTGTAAQEGACPSAGTRGHFPAAPPPAPSAQIDSFVPQPPPNTTISFPHAAAQRPPWALPRRLGPLSSA